ncbi:MFS transporter [Paenibacillus dokdonensis]|uniref:MFS transporter n=1 Tax=Paenibacillus dokdonensis TaxID=2567944 RepID=A0ABU6GWS1_9BACL|nr:MFS transporter [Paenibacillus dokdonensis]MEC0243145.1 MFS transporter [Paenibacillus dokdonensis]
MSNDIRKLLIMNIISSIISIYIAIFVNLYIWESNHGIGEVSLYNLSMYICWGLTFALASKLINRYSIRVLLAISAVCGAMAFMYLMTVHLDNRLLWITLLGIPVGMMFGFSQSSQNLGIAMQGKENELAPYFAAVNITSQALNMAVPILSAAVIQGFGYRGSFITMLIFIAVMLIYSSRMPRIYLPPQTSAIEIREPIYTLGFRSAFGYPGAKWVLLSLLAAGIFLQFQNLFALLFTFSVTQNKLWIALLNLLYTLSSLLGLLLYRRIKFNEMKWLWIGTLLLAFGFLIALLHNPIMLIASNVFTSVGMFYFSIVWNAQQFKYIKHLSPATKRTFLVWRECILVFTRCLLLSLTFSLTEMRGMAFGIIVIITIACLVAIPVFQKLAGRENSKMNQTPNTSKTEQMTV